MPILLAFRTIGFELGCILKSLISEFFGLGKTLAMMNLQLNLEICSPLQFSVYQQVEEIPKHEIGHGLSTQNFLLTGPISCDIAYYVLQHFHKKLECHTCFEFAFWNHSEKMLCIQMDGLPVSKSQEHHPNVF